MLSPTQWQSVRDDYEQEHETFSALERKYGVSRTAIRKHAEKERWVSPETSPTPLEPVAPVLPADALSIARSGLAQLARHLQTESLLDISQHKSLSDALAQYVKVLLIAPVQQEQEQEGIFIPLDRVSPSTRKEIRRLLAEDEQAREGVS